MNWFNENAGVVVLILGIVLIVMTGLSVYLLFYLKSRIAVQRLSFLGFYSTSLDTHKNYADFVIGNKTVNTVGISEIGLKNGKIAFNLTALYREKTGLPQDAKLVIGQRSSISFRLTSEELKRTVVTSPDGKKKIGALRVYAVDLTGTLYQGKVANVRKLLLRLMEEEKATREAENAAEE